MNSYWIESTEKITYPTLTKNLETDVCVIGGGMTGVATAYSLTKARISCLYLRKG